MNNLTAKSLARLIATVNPQLFIKKKKKRGCKSAEEKSARDNMKIDNYFTLK
jgi:hypothetical protein